MIFGNLYYRLIFILLFSPSLIFTQDTNQITRGPSKGSLLLMGGGQHVKEINEKFIELAGGPNANILVIPTAGGREIYDEQYSWVRIFKDAGAEHVKLLHTTNRDEANSVKFSEMISNADAIWFGGGRQWRLVDVYGGTLSEEAFWKVLDKGGVIGGTSAGATIQGSFLARGDTEHNQIMTGDHTEGFGFIQNIAIDQHCLARNRHFDMFTIQREFPSLLGICIDESTALIVHDNKFEVIGDHYVLIYDQHFWSGEGSAYKEIPAPESLFYFLKQGDRYDLLNRKVIR